MRGEAASKSNARRVVLIALWMAGGAIGMILAHRLFSGGFGDMTEKAVIGGLIGLVTSPVGWLGRGIPSSHDS